MPTWRQGQAVGEWRQISGTALSSAPINVKTYPTLGATGPASKTVAWTGYAIDGRDGSVYSAANGGHGDYAGNEVNRVRLMDNVPAWVEVKSSTASSQVVACRSHYADGRPTSRHTYYGSIFNEVRGRTMTLGGSRYGDGYNTPTFDGFSVAGGDWDPAGTYPSVPSSAAGSQGCAYAGARSKGDVYVFCGWSIDRWNNATNTWTKLIGSSAIYGQGAASAHDSLRNSILVVGGTNNEHHIYDIATNKVTAISFSGTAGASIASSGTGNGMVYDPLLDAYLLRTGAAGGTVYKINAQTFAVDVLATTAGSSVPASTNGVWSRFLYVPTLKGVVYFPTFTGNAWFLRTN